jgi:hypothetical protein
MGDGRAVAVSSFGLKTMMHMSKDAIKSALSALVSSVAAAAN